MIGPLTNAIRDLAHAVRGHGGTSQTEQKLESILHRIEQSEKNIMSKITEWAATQEADLNEIKTNLDGIANGIVALDKQIADLNNSPGKITPEDQAALDRIQASSKALVARAKDIRVDAETNPPVEPS